MARDEASLLPPLAAPEGIALVPAFGEPVNECGWVRWPIGTCIRSRQIDHSTTFCMARDLEVSPDPFVRASQGRASYRHVSHRRASHRRASRASAAAGWV
jgi:hypothetical protein